MRRTAVFLLLLIGASLFAATSRPAEKKTKAVKKYLIKEGDNLHRISKKLYGKSDRWREIAELNALDNPDLILTGNELKVKYRSLKKKGAKVSSSKRSAPKPAPAVTPAPAPVVPIEETKTVSTPESAPVASPEPLTTHNDAPPPPVATEEFIDSERGNEDLTPGDQTNLLSFGFMAGLTYLFPFLHYQHAITTNVSVGIMPVAYHNFSSSDPDTIYGGFLTLTGALERGPFDGPYVSLGAGAYSVYARSASREFRSTPLALYLNGGWRKRVLRRVNLGASAGIQYTSTRSGDSDLLRFGGFMPMITFSIGYAF